MDAGGGSLHERVGAALRDLIVEGALPPGSRISERELCARFGISRTPLREALKVLAREGLAPLLEKIVVSSEVGVQKPDERIFHLALEGTGVRGEECLYVGDNFYDDALGSRKVGMRPVILNPFGRLGVEEIGGVPILPDISRLEEHLERLRSPASAR